MNAPDNHNDGVVLLWPVAMLIVYASTAFGWLVLR